MVVHFSIGRLAYFSSSTYNIERKAIQIETDYKTEKPMSYQIYIYTLALEDGFYYVGKTIDPDRRFNEHFNDNGAAWTKLHPPVSVIEKESFLVSSPEEEDRWENHQTIKMMKAKGWQMVRGGYWCNIGELETLKNLQHHNYFLDVDIEDVSFSEREHYIYLLELENSKFFVGYARNLQSAIKNHEKGKASSWTQTYKPVQLLKYQKVVFENGIPNVDMVNEWVVQCGAEYGYENVRGGSFTQWNSEHHLRLIQSFLRKKGNYKSATGFSMHSKLIEEYEENNSVIDYDLPLNDNERVMIVFVLALADGNYHVSYSSDFLTLMQKYERGKCCEWCKFHAPIKLLEVIPVISPKDYLDIIDELDPIVEKYFNKYGAEKVRGGRFSIVDENLHMKKVFERYKMIEGKYIEYTKKEMNHLKYERRKQQKMNISNE